MRRSAAPSTIYKKQKLEDGVFETITKEIDNDNDFDKKIQEYEHSTSITNGIVKDEENKSISSVEIQKNYCINKEDGEICFAVKYKNTKVGAKKNLGGDGVLLVSHNDMRLFNMDGREIAFHDIERDPIRGDCEDYEICTDYQQRVLILKGKKKVEIYIFPPNVIMVSKHSVDIRFHIELDEFKSGLFFIRTPEEIEKKAQIVKKSNYICLATKRPTGWIVPFKKDSVSRIINRTGPLFDPNAEGAIVLSPGNSLKKEVAVVVDPILSKHLRPHQVDGVKFMYDCLMGLRGFKGNGCILADDMGLGKTIQAITLIWTLINQGPKSTPVVKKTVIVAPSSLVGNWCQEFKKWLGDSINPIPFGESKKAKSNLAHFEYSYDIKTNILVASYDQLKINIDKICKIKDIDLVICDEGHRLKNSLSKQSLAVDKLPAKKRIILSGTPIQNNLGEFHAMVSFCNPGILKNISTFQTVYADKIMLMKEPNSTIEERKIGRERSAHLSRLTSEFILRRTATTNRKYLPPKIDHVLICKLTPLQEKIYKHICMEFQKSGAGTTSVNLPKLKKSFISSTMITTKTREITNDNGGDDDDDDNDNNIDNKNNSESITEKMRKTRDSKSDSDTQSTSSVQNEDEYPCAKIVKNSKNDIDDVESDSITESDEDDPSKYKNKLNGSSNSKRIAKENPVLSKNNLKKSQKMMSNRCITDLEGKNNNPDDESSRTRNIAFSNISNLKKLCNDPSLVYESFKELFPDDYDPRIFMIEYSSKLMFTECLLKQLRNSGRDKIVIISNYTQTLSLLIKMCKKNKWGYFQLDGSVPTSKRQIMVNEFNDHNRDEFVFLLSSKAGGCGLNLIGANHLVMFDPDWNPANDNQAMGRVWRPGQEKKVYLYRLLSTGTIEEKIYQRQVAKLSLAQQVVEGDTDSIPDFSSKDLRDIFSYRGADSISDTHDLLNCKCSRSFKKIPLHKRQASKVDELVNWKHYDDTNLINQHSFLKDCNKYVSFTFLLETDPAKETVEKPEIDVEEVALDFGKEDVFLEKEYYGDEDNFCDNYDDDNNNSNNNYDDYDN